jgi:hypothetical protein
VEKLPMSGWSRQDVENEPRKSDAYRIKTAAGSLPPFPFFPKLDR